MRTFLLAAILYLLGVAFVLFLRPAGMFEETGQWKEFGTAGANRTLFPFWMFCILWSIVSYLLATAILHASGSNSTALAATAAVAGPLFRRPDQEEFSPEDMVMPLPAKGLRGPDVARVAQGNMKPGYYMLNRQALRKTGIPKYIYLGPEPDEEEDDVADIPTTTSE